MPSATFMTYGGNEKEIIRRGVGAIGKKRSLLLEARGIDLEQEQRRHRKRLSKISAVSSDIRRVAVRLVERSFRFYPAAAPFPCSWDTRTVTAERTPRARDGEEWKSPPLPRPPIGNSS